MVAESGYEFIDHPADVLVHAFGPNLERAFEQCVHALMKTMTDPEKIQVTKYHEFEVKDDNLGALLVSFLSEFLFIFDTLGLIFSNITIESLHKDHNGVWELKVKCGGEVFNPDCHFQDTEVKAITYSYLEINQQPDRVDIKIIYDI